MPLSSMTGFARAAGGNGAAMWAWELKSVNGKALDVRLRLPPGLDHLDMPVRQAVAHSFKRGSFQISLALEHANATERIAVNRAVLDQYLKIADELRVRTGSSPPSAENLLALKGVIETVSHEMDDAETMAFDAAVLASLKQGVEILAKSRRAEGDKLQQLVAVQLGQIEALRQKAVVNPARTPEAIKKRLKEQVAELMQAGNLNEERLHQEAVLLATRADIQEELDRLDVHITAAHELMKSSEPVGRKFDFLAQEFNREANTLCSKANDASLTAIGLDLKTVIDQMREQVQNIE